MVAGMRKQLFFCWSSFHISLLLLAALLPYLMIVAFWWQRHALRTAMKEKIEFSHLVKITVAESEFFWVKKNKEIIVHGSMFDIHEFKENNGQYTFEGLYDKDEKALLAAFEKIHQKTSKNGSLQNAFSLFFLLGQGKTANSYLVSQPIASTLPLTWSMAGNGNTSKGYHSPPYHPPGKL